MAEFGWASNPQAPAMRPLIAVPDAASFGAHKPPIATTRQAEGGAEGARSIAEVGIWYYDYALDLVSWSNAEFRIFGVTPDTFQPSFANFLECVHPDDRDAMVAANRDATFGRPMDFEHRIVRPDGEVRHVREQAQIVIGDEFGGHQILIGTTQDITDSKEGEARASAQEVARDRSSAARGPVEPAGRQGDPGACPAQIAMRLYKARRLRERYFPPAWLAEPAWDLLLDLYIAHLEDRTVTTLGASVAANVASSTGIRWVEKLEAAALVQRSPCATDKRLRIVTLTDDAIAQMTDLLIQTALQYPFPGRSSR